MVLISQAGRTERGLLNRTAPVNAGDILLNVIFSFFFLPPLHQCPDEAIWMLLMALLDIDRKKPFGGEPLGQMDAKKNPKYWVAFIHQAKSDESCRTPPGANVVEIKSF